MNRQPPRDDRGAVLVIVAAFSIVAVLFLAFVVDIGDQRQNRRQLTTETDSIALAVAKEWTLASLDSNFDCDDTMVDDELFAANNPVGNASPDHLCTFDQTDRRRGVVSVTDRESVDFEFGSITGINNQSTGSLTSVGVASVKGGGVRPLALCALEPNIAAWIAAAAVGMPDDEAVLTFDKEGMGCGGAAGNWGEVIMPGAGAGLADWRRVVLDGADEDVSVGQYLDAQPGIGMNSAEDAFDDLKASEPIFHLPVYQNNPSSAPGGPGANAKYQVLGFLEVELIDFEASGSDATLTIRPISWDPTGPCCRITPFNAELTICDVGTVGGSEFVDADACLPPLVMPPVPPILGPDPDDCNAKLEASPSELTTKKDKSDVSVYGDHVFTLSFADSSKCGTISGMATFNSGTLVPLTGGGPAVSPMSLTLEGATPLKTSDHAAVVRFYNDVAEELLSVSYG